MFRRWTSSHSGNPQASKTILVTGWASFIGSHTYIGLLQADYLLVVIDNFSNSSPDALRRIIKLAGCKIEGRLRWVGGDICCPRALKRAFDEADSSPSCIEAVIHFAGLKSVGESVSNPLAYWDVDVTRTRCLLQTMSDRCCRTIVFSSSTTVYGILNSVSITENA